MGSMGEPQVAVPTLAPMGTDRMAQMPQVAERLNFRGFHSVPVGSAMRVAGRLTLTGSGATGYALTTTDGGSILVTSGSGDDFSTLSGFVEVVGTKAENGTLQALGVVPLGDGVDVELWDEAVKMMQHPQLRQLFQPNAVTAAA